MAPFPPPRRRIPPFLLLFLVLLARWFFFARPPMLPLRPDAAPRPIEARGDLALNEKSTNYAIGQEIVLGLIRNGEHLQVKLMLEAVD